MMKAVSEQTKIVIKTSAQNWLKKVSEFYKKREAFVLVDDAHVGVDPRQDTLLQMGRKAQLSRREWAGVLVSLGVASVGVWLLVMAVTDPEPYSKVMAAVLAGAVLVGSGGMMAIRILTHIKPPKVRVGSGGFEIEWE
jgi:hypothetical protein